MKQVVDHLEHLEDLVITDADAGAAKTVKFLVEMVRVLQGSAGKQINVSIKFDGSPSIIFGTDPVDGEFFVATKALFNQEPRLFKTYNSIGEYYQDKPELCRALQTAYYYIKPLGWKGIYQGDVLFTQLDLVNEWINGALHIIFQPNTLVYAAPLESALGQRIARSKLGLAVHTEYTGDSLATLKAKPFKDKLALPDKDNLVFVTTGQFQDVSGTATFTKFEYRYITRIIRELGQRLDGLRNNRFLGLLHNEPQVLAAYRQFQNSLIKRDITIKPEETATSFGVFCADVMAEKEMKKRLSDAARKRVQARWLHTVALVLQQRADITAVAEWQQRVVHCKNLLLGKLNRAQFMGAFVATPEGLRTTSQEGFVAVDHDGHMVKLVDRMNFSRLNFLTHSQT